MKRAFVTGATGFVGLNLVEELCSAGYEVVALHRPTSDLRFLERLRARCASGTITDKASIEAAMEEGVDAVFHVAANVNVWSRNNAEQVRDNVDGTRNVVDVALAKGARRFVLTSSVVVFGLGGGLFDESSPLRGRDSWINYMRTKSLADDLVRDAAARGLSAAVMRPAHILGKYDRRNWATMIRLVARGELPAVPSGAGSFCNAREVARAHIRAAERRGALDVFVLGGPRATLAELVRVIGDIAGREVPARVAPDLVLRAAARVFQVISAVTGTEPRATPEGVAMATHEFSVDDSKARTELGYAHVPLSESVRESYAFLRSEGLL